MGVGHGVFKYYTASKLNAERKKAGDKRKSIKK
jgi:hypothetical protein